MATFKYSPIGVIRTPYKRKEDMPIQGSFFTESRGVVEVYKKYSDGLSDLKGFSHIILLYHFHKSSGFELKPTPFMDTVPRGVFSTRAPRRPNNIGLSIVRLDGVEGSRLYVSEVDMLDGTPLLDIKPYVPHFDVRNEVEIGWFEGKIDKHDKISDKRFS